MRKPKISALFVCTIAFAAFTIGFFLGRNQSITEISVSIPDKFMTKPVLQTEPEDMVIDETEEVTFPIAINHANKEALMALPGIGEVLASRIIDYREENGHFSAVEELLNIEGVGKKRLEEIIDLITIGG